MATLAGRVQAGTVSTLAVPATEHDRPLRYAAGAHNAEDRIEFLNGGFDPGSLSMRSVLYRQD